MAKDTVVLSPELKGYGRREAIASAAIMTGTFLSYVGGQYGAAVPAMALAPKLVAVENIANASGLDYEYSAGENVMAQSLPSGALVNVKAIPGTYNAGDLLEVGVGGLLTALAAGVAVAVVPSFSGEVVVAGSSLLVELV